eukprot:TRINITY_DN9385_c0_g2_i1.p1 TRINITY_DN9385_c0_g2~~TRINITY_DN9385_c0_g2_i1.p1  ORF type:complete len:389 (+),score=81.05 TRINITY_DN9385_c0_g2_i1:26-1168(+)
MAVVAPCPRLLLGTGITGFTGITTADLPRAPRALPGQSAKLLDQAVLAAFVAHASSRRTRQALLERATETETLQNQSFEARDLGDKGMGAVALRKITMGEQVLMEAPILCVPGPFDIHPTLKEYDSYLRARLASCGQQEQHAFWELADVYCGEGPKTAAGILITNAIVTPHGNTIFPTASRFNHSCNPNVYGVWQGQGESLLTDMGIFHATRDIEAGEEMCISYKIELRATREQRQEELPFQCRCATCSADGEVLRKSDARRRQLGILVENLHTLVLQVDTLRPEPLKQLVQTIEGLLDEELGGSPPKKCEVFHGAFRLAMEAGFEELAADLARKAWENAVISEGPASRRTLHMRRLVDDPWSYDNEDEDDDDVEDADME